VLRLAAESRDPAILHSARELLIKITGGRIELAQRGEPKAQRGWLRATFQVRLLKPILEDLGCCCQPSPCREVVIDLKKPSHADSIASEARGLYDQGMTQKVIARRLKVNRNVVTEALDISFAAEGKTRPDGRARRWHVSESRQRHCRFHEVADNVMVFYNQGLPIEEIATRVREHRNTVTAAVRYWHQQRGLEVPDGRARRKQLRLKRLEGGQADAAAS
jgi:site-specific DNA recombinase